MSRTILYYPNIEIPASGQWIGRALLYWDDIAAIVPRSYNERLDEQAVRRFRPEVQELYERKIFRPLNPEKIFMDGTAADAFTTDWKTINVELTRKFTPLKKPNCNVPIYKDKSTHNIFYDLEARGLAKESPNRSLYLFESSTAAIYMALLAKHMAAAQTNPTIPGTDIEKLSDLAFGKNGSGSMQPVLSTRLADVIPVPSPSVPLKAIIDFRERYQAELFFFRAAMDDFEKTLAAATDNAEIVNETERFKERVVRETSDLRKALKSTNISTVLGSLQAFIKPTSPTLIGAAAVLAGKATSLVAIPITWVIAGTSAVGLIEVGMHWFGKLQERRKALQNTPFAYLFLARKKLVRL